MADENQQQGPIFAIQRVYVRDISFESPSTPHIFREQWKPEINLDLQTKATTIEEGVHEVVLSLTVTVKQGDKTAFLVEVHQGGVFTVQGFEDAQQNHVLGSMCPNILYPFAREAVADAVTRGGFPQLLLAPVNFEALYAQHLKQEAESGGEGGKGEKGGKGGGAKKTDGETSGKKKKTSKKAS